MYTRASVKSFLEPCAKCNGDKLLTSLRLLALVNKQTNKQTVDRRGIDASHRQRGSHTPYCCQWSYIRCCCLYGLLIRSLWRMKTILRTTEKQHSLQKLNIELLRFLNRWFHFYLRCPAAAAAAIFARASGQSGFLMLATGFRVVSGYINRLVWSVCYSFTMGL